MTDTTSHAAPTGTEPLLSRAWVVSVCAAGVSLGTLFGLPAALGDTINADAVTYGGVIATVLAFAGPHVLAFLGRKKVTPLTNPKTDDLTPLVPATAVPSTATVVTTPIDEAAMAADATTLLAAAAAIHPPTQATAPASPTA